MSAQGLPGAHAEPIEALTKRGDWAGLVRYWMAHGCQQAIERAIALVGSDGEGGEGDTLYTFLREAGADPFSPKKKPPTIAGLNSQ